MCIESAHYMFQKMPHSSAIVLISPIAMIRFGERLEDPRSHRDQEWFYDAVATMPVRKLACIGANVIKGLTIGQTPTFGKARTNVIQNRMLQRCNICISITFVDNDGEEKHIGVPLGVSMLEAAHANDIDLEGNKGTRWHPLSTLPRYTEILLLIVTNQSYIRDFARRERVQNLLDYGWWSWPESNALQFCQSPSFNLLRICS